MLSSHLTLTIPALSNNLCPKRKLRKLYSQLLQGQLKRLLNGHLQLITIEWHFCQFFVPMQINTFSDIKKYSQQLKIIGQIIYNKSAMKKTGSAENRIEASQYWKHSSEDYEIVVEFDAHTMLVQLDTWEGKSYRKIICDYGEHKVKFYGQQMKVREIVTELQENPHDCLASHRKGLLLYKNKTIQLDKVRLVGRKQRQVQFRRQCRNSVDRSTPFAGNFHTEDNTITLVKGIQGQNRHKKQQLLFGMVVGRQRSFNFHVCIKRTHYGCLIVGIVDRVCQKNAQTSLLSGNEICYCGDMCSYITYGENGKAKERLVGIPSCAVVEVKLRVQMDIHTVIFSLIDTQGKSHQQSVRSGILGQTNRQFVPYLEMEDEADCVTWFID